MGSAGHVGDRVTGAADSGARSVGEVASNAQEALRHAPERAEPRHPRAAGLVAFGVGALAGTLLPPTGPEKQLASGLEGTFEDPVRQPLSTAAEEVQGELQEHAQRAVEEVQHAAPDAPVCARR